MNALILQSNSTLQASSKIIPDTNVRPDVTPIIPERFGSTTKPAKIPILPPEFGSVSEIEAPNQAPSKK